MHFQTGRSTIFSHRRPHARNATDVFSGFLKGKEYIIIDRDPRYTRKFRDILFSERQLRMAVDEYMQHYHVEWNHQGLGNELIDGVPEPRASTGEVVCMPRPGGLLKHYRRAA